MQLVVFDLDHTLFNEDQTLREGAKELIIILRSLGLQVAGLSNEDYRVLVRLDEAGLRPLFDDILCADQTLEPKQASGMYHLLSNLGMHPSQAVMVSHAHSDILLGKDAGVGMTIGVSHGVDSLAPLRDAGADYVVEAVPGILDVLQ